MAALLVALAVMAVLMSVALPVWKHDARRAREEELVWRGQQYVRAIRLFNQRTGALPPNIDVLVTGRYLRKKYKDPITNDDFQVLNAGATAPGQAGQIAQPQPFASAPSPVLGAVMGVVSKSKDESIRIYQGRNHYNEWTFLFVNQQPTAPTGPGGQPILPGGPGRGRGNGPGRGFPGGRGRGFPDGRGFGGRGPGAGGSVPGGPLMPIRRGGGGL